MSSFYVLKFNGEKEPFSFNKVYGSARRVGASKDFAKEIAKIVEKEAYQGIKTSEIFRKVKKLLKREKIAASFKFNLKNAMRRLGPTGFPFEKYVTEIFSKNGFKTKLNQNIKGSCCKYEIDFLAEKKIYCILRNASIEIFLTESSFKYCLGKFCPFLRCKERDFLKDKSLKFGD